MLPDMGQLMDEMGTHTQGRFGKIIGHGAPRKVPFWMEPDVPVRSHGHRRGLEKHEFQPQNPDAPAFDLFSKNFPCEFGFSDRHGSGFPRFC